MNKIQGEDERALVELFTAWLDGEYDKESFLFGFHFDKGQREGSVAGYRNMATGFRAGYLSALRAAPDAAALRKADDDAVARTLQYLNAELDKRDVTIKTALERLDFARAARALAARASGRGEP